MSVALYRKYRPTDFASVKGQDHIVTVLQGALKKQEIPHALLFAGGRGTGKTTLARIFAREIGASDVDVYEIDAASNRGIDDIRELREAVQTVPYESPYKVYIIDEVHMLTKEAFNALLKTLEEPPAHVVFVLATTEEDKLLDTIRSRCQVFRFHSPSQSVLAQTAQEVAHAEGYQLTNDAAQLVALAADGSFRDALGVTQKVLLASGDTIGSVDEVATIIGAPRQETLLDFLRALAAQDTQAALAAIAEAVSNQTDMQLFVRVVLEDIRTAILARYGSSKAKEVLSDSTPKAVLLKDLSEKQAASINSNTIKHLLVAADQVGRSPIPQLPLEVAVLDITAAEKLPA